MDKSYDVVQFLVVCIRSSNNGKPDWSKVAATLNIQKEAARKRYERLMKNTVIPAIKNGDVDEPKNVKAKVDKPKNKKAQGRAVTTPKAESTSPKKRKISAEETDGDETDEPPITYSSHKPAPRPRRSAARKTYVESEEEEDDEDDDDKFQISEDGETGEEVGVVKNEDDCV